MSPCYMHTSTNVEPFTANCFHMVEYSYRWKACETPTSRTYSASKYCKCSWSTSGTFVLLARIGSVVAGAIGLFTMAEYPSQGSPWNRTALAWSCKQLQKVYI